MLRSLTIILICLPIMFGFSFLTPKNIGLQNDQLPPCKSTLNCVCSEHHSDESFISPIVFEYEPEAAWITVQKTIEDSGGKIEKLDNRFLWARFTTPLMRFVDDVQLRLDPENKKIHIRSASRVGRRDFGVNRKRIEKLREQFQTEM